MKNRLIPTIICGVSAAILVISCGQEPKSDARAITAFSLTNPAEPGIIDSVSKTINIQVPGGTDLTTLVASFVSTGVKVSVGSEAQTSGVTANNFTNPVVYTVTADNNATENYTVTVSFYKRCLFLSAAIVDPMDSALVEKVRSWKYDVTVQAPFALGAWDSDSFARYDFMFLSESPNSSDYGMLRGHPLPILNLEAWAADKGTVLNWGVGATVSNYDVHSSVISGNTGHELLAGMANGTEFRLVDSTSVPGEAVIAFAPGITVIPIATLKDSVTRVCACAVEKGTPLADDALPVKHRAVTIGIHANAYQFITKEGYELIQAGIRWILSEAP